MRDKAALRPLFDYFHTPICNYTRIANGCATLAASLRRRKTITHLRRTQ